MSVILDWFFKVAIIWFSLSVLIMATGWYVGTVIKDCWPGWWRRHLVGRAPGRHRW